MIRTRNKKDKIKEKATSHDPPVRCYYILPISSFAAGSLIYTPEEVPTHSANIGI